MKSIENLVSDYIFKCAKDGICTIEDMKKHIDKEIHKINEKLVAVEPLRLERANLQKISEKFSAMLQEDKAKSEFDDDSKEMADMHERVIRIVDKQSPLSNREIILKFQEEDQDAYNEDAKIIRAIKFLADKGILDKNEDRKIIKGPKWDQQQSL